MCVQVSTFTSEVLGRKSATQRATSSVLWGVVNVLVVGILCADFHSGGFTAEPYVWWGALFFCLICLTNVLVHLKRYFGLSFKYSALEITDKQRKLLSVNDSDIGFKAASAAQATSTPVPDKLPTLSELFQATKCYTPPHQSLASPVCADYFRTSSGITTLSGSPTLPTSPLSSSVMSSPSFNLSISSTNSSDHMGPSVVSDSWSFHRSPSAVLDSSCGVIPSPQRNVFNVSHVSNFPLVDVPSTSSSLRSPVGTPKSPQFPRLLLTPQGVQEKSIRTRRDLEEYLSDFNEKEKQRQVLLEVERNISGGSPLWTYTSTLHSALDLSSDLKRNVYQPALQDEGQDLASPDNKSDLKTQNVSSSSVQKIWQKRNVTPQQLFQYEEHLRYWLSMNVLCPVVELTKSCNEDLKAMAPELQVGCVGIDKLRKAAQNISGVKRLNNLLPFLDITIHQDYLIDRITALSRGGAISAYRWNSGGSFNGKPWREEYPTDTFVLLHLFALYMDSRLPPDLTLPDGRVFSTVYLIKTPEKPPSPVTHPCLYLCQVNPPHLIVVLPGEGETDVGAGHKNFLHSLLLFIHHLVHQQNSHIAGVNLDLSGINLSWVVNAE